MSAREEGDRRDENRENGHHSSYDKCRCEQMVLSTRIRLARNFEGMPFPNRLSPQQAGEVVDRAASAIAKSPMGSDFSLIFLKSNTPTENNALVERHLVSPDLLKHVDRGAVLLSKEKNISIMICEEDHLRIQAIMDGCELDGAYELASKADDIIAQSERYAYSDRYGFLTACPTNVGTGMRASFMLHLPTLTMLGQVEAIGQAVGRLGMTVRGFYGEGSRAFGSIYQISNQVTLGRSEKDTLRTLEEVAMQVIEKEQNARDMLLEHNDSQIRDKLLRSYGILRYAHKLGSQELLQLWSDVRLGVSLGMIDEIDTQTADSLLLLQPAELIQRAKKEMTAGQRDIFRAECAKLILSGQSQ